MQTFRDYAGTVKTSDAMNENKRGAPPTAQRASTRTYAVSGKAMGTCGFRIRRGAEITEPRPRRRLLSDRRTHALRDTLQRVATRRSSRCPLADLPALRDLNTRGRPLVFDPRPVHSKFFEPAIERAQAALKEAGKDVSRLEGYAWDSNRHTFASRLVMAGVDLRTVQELGGWRSLAMVQKYAHLAPAHRLAAVEALVRAPELFRNLPEPSTAEPPARLLVRPERFELPTLGFVVRCSVHLS